MTDPGLWIALAALAAAVWLVWKVHVLGRRLDERAIERDIERLTGAVNDARNQMAASVQLFQANLTQSHLALEHAERIERDTERLLDIALERSTKCKP